MLFGNFDLQFALAGLELRRDFHSFVEQSMDEKSAWRLDSMRHRLGRIPIEKMQDFVERETPYRLIGAFPQELRAFVIVGAAAFVESQLMCLCHDLAAHHKMPWEGSKKDKFSAIRKFLQELEVDAPSETTWQELNNLQYFRNKLVHYGFHLASAPRNDIEELQKRFPEIGRDDEDPVLTRQLCDRAFKIAEVTLIDFAGTLP